MFPKRAMFPECSMNVPLMFPKRSLNVPCVLDPFGMCSAVVLGKLFPLSALVIHRLTVLHMWQCYKCVTQLVLLALGVLHMYHADGVAGTGSVTYVSRGWCCWLW
jgi:hypothetical protein